VATIDEDIVALLAADAGVSALVSARIYPDVPAESTVLPCIVYRRISGPRVQILSGPNGLAHPRFEFNCLATSKGGAKTVADAVRAALDGHRGNAFVDVTLLDERSFFDNEPKQYRADVDFEIFHTE
jgi:hypothetical protein